MKNISFKVPDYELARVKYYMSTPEGGNTSIAVFVRKAMKERCDRAELLRRGDTWINLSSPVVEWLTPDKRNEALVILKQADTDLTKLHRSLGGYMAGLIEYLEYHFFDMEDAEREAIDARFIADLGAEARFDDMENAEDDAVEARCKAIFKD